LEEPPSSLLGKAPRAVEAFEELMTLVSAKIETDPSPSQLQPAASYINLKDAPIVAAVNAKSGFLVTLDHKHFIADPQVAQKSGLNILTPDELPALLRSEG